jgi:hypothetical protein
MWQWCVNWSSSAVVILASPNMLDHSANLRFVVIRTINWQVVHAIIAGHLDDFKDFARAGSLWQAGSLRQGQT